MSTKRFPKIVAEGLMRGSQLRLIFDFTNSFRVNDIIGPGLGDYQQLHITEIDGTTVYVTPIFKEGQNTIDRTNIYPGVEYQSLVSCVGEYDTLPDYSVDEIALYPTPEKESPIEEVHEDHKTIFRVKK